MPFDPYCYPNTNVLINKFDIHSNDELDVLESNITAVNLSQFDLLKEIFVNGFDYNSLLNLHRFIFGDLYDWAGTIRTIEMSKREKVLGGVSVNYALPTTIEIKAKRSIEHLNKHKWNYLSLDEKAVYFAKGIADLWKVHPFREGNTRTIITFACEFADAHGFPMDRSLFSKHSKYTRDALVLASIGKYSEYEHLINIFKDSMEQDSEQPNEQTDELDDEIILPYEYENKSYYHK